MHWQDLAKRITQHEQNLIFSEKEMLLSTFSLEIFSTSLQLGPRENQAKKKKKKRKVGNLNRHLKNDIYTWRKLRKGLVLLAEQNVELSKKVVKSQSWMASFFTDLMPKKVFVLYLLFLVYTQI